MTKSVTKRKTFRKKRQQFNARNAQLALYGQQLRSKPTQAETRFELWLCKQGLRYRVQHVMNPYIVDFYLPDYGVVIEIDGPAHNSQQSYDEKRSRVLLGRTDVVEVVRYENNEKPSKKWETRLTLQLHKHTERTR